MKGPFSERRELWHTTITPTRVTSTSTTWGEKARIRGNSSTPSAAGIKRRIRARSGIPGLGSTRSTVSRGRRRMFQVQEVLVERADFSFEALEADYEKLWAECELCPKRHVAFTIARSKIEAAKVRFAAVEEATYVPWYVVGCFHYRESNMNFRTWLYNGDPMFNHLGHAICTTHVPRGLPKNPAVSWLAGAIDAMREAGLAGITAWPPARCAWAGERFNGFGYREFHHIPSPYIWGGTTVQKPGKYIRDHDYDPSEMDEQLGIMGIIKLILGDQK